MCIGVTVLSDSSQFSLQRITYKMETIVLAGAQYQLCSDVVFKCDFMCIGNFPVAEDHFIS